jgi:hypothetical protein
VTAGDDGDRLGRFRFSGLPQGSYDLVVDDGRAEIAASLVLVELAS